MRSVVRHVAGIDDAIPILAESSGVGRGTNIAAGATVGRVSTEVCLTPGAPVAVAVVERRRARVNLAVAAGWRVFYLTTTMLRGDPERWLGLIAEAIREE